jgi:hypothetical protein
MGLQKHQGQFVIKATSQEDLAPHLLEIFRDELYCLAADHLDMSGNTVSFAGYFIGPSTGLLAGISHGTISATSTDAGVIVQYTIFYRRFVIVATVLILIAVIWMRANECPTPFALICLSFGWLWLVGMNIGTKNFRFNRFIKKCAKRVGATDIKRIKTTTLSK